MSQEVKIGFIGCGGNAGGHMRTLMNMEDVRIVATCDIVEELAARAAEQCNAQAYTNHKAMLERDDLDGIYISIPVFAHGQPELDTIQRGLPFFVEKPVAINMETAKIVESAVSNSGIITCVGYQLRYTGALGSLTASWTYDPKDWSNANVLDILFDESHIHWEGGKVILKEQGETKELIQPGKSIDAVFIEAVRRKDGSQIRSPYSDAVKSLAISLAANESAISGAAKIL